MNTNILIPLNAIAIAALVGGCAVQTLPSAQIASSEAAISTALSAGAATSAPREMALATEKLELTRRWIEARDYKPARWLAEQAQVDAELASMKAIGVRGRP
jgi:hypothetical protein